VGQAQAGLGDAGGAQVLAECAGGAQHRQRAELADPVGIVFEGIGVDRLVRAAVKAGIALLVAVDAEWPDGHPARARRLGNRAPASPGECHGAAGKYRAHLSQPGLRRHRAWTAGAAQAVSDTNMPVRRVGAMLSSRACRRYSPNSRWL